MRAVITGASGHLGSCLTNSLCQQGHSVLAVVRPESDLWRLDRLPELQILPVSIQELKTSKQAGKFRPDVIFHLAWAGVTQKERNSTEAVSSNLTNTLELLEYSKAVECKTWIGVGSQAEYGLFDTPRTEDSVCEPVSLYGAGKLAANYLARTACKLNGARFVWFRLYSTYGPFDDPRRLLPTVTEKLLAGKAPALTGGEQVWDYLYIFDAVEALIEAAQQEAISGIFNLGSGKPVLIRDAVEMLRDVIDPKLPLKFGEIPYGVDQPVFLQADITKWMGVAQWRVRTPLLRGLRQTVAWHRNRKWGQV